MPDLKDDASVVNILREKTEEADLNQYLKTSFRGYTKKSVLNYLAILKKQQQDTAKTFHNNLQALLMEKEGLKEKNQILQDRLSKIENEYKNLCESVHAPEPDGVSIQDIADLKKTISARESEINHINDLNRSLNREIINLKETNKAMSGDLERSRQETQIQKNLLLSEKSELKKQREKNNELINNIADSRDKIKYLKGAVSEANISEMQGTIASLTAKISTQADIIANCNDQSNLKEQTIETLTSQNESMKQNLEALSSSLENSNAINEKLVSSNSALKNMLEDHYKKEITLVNEKSDTIIDKLAADKRLDEANEKISALEMHISQLKRHAVTTQQQ